MSVRRIIGIDPGNVICGMAVLDDGQITAAFNVEHLVLWNKVTEFLIHPNCTVVLEDIRPYSLALTPQLIDTIKFIGEATDRLRIACGRNLQLHPRSAVKKWVFDAFPAVVTPLIDARIEKKGFRNKETGEFRKASFNYVNDRAIVEAMKYLYKIETPKAGKSYAFGLKDHNWQALGIASFVNFVNSSFSK